MIMMESELGDEEVNLDIYRSANLLVKQHG